MGDEDDVPLLRAGDDIEVEFDGAAVITRSTISKEFTARITGRDGCPTENKWIYSWEEMEPSGTSVDYVVKTDGRVGTFADSPAFELNNVKVEPGTIVKMIERGFTDAAFSCTGYAGSALNSLIYEFQYGGSGSNSMACVHVSSVQCTGGQLAATYDTECITP